MEQIRVSTFAGPGAQPVIHTVPRPKISSKAALIKVGACGVCGTDLHILKGHWPKQLPWPFTLGHELGGVLVEVGNEFKTDFMEKQLAVGSKVMIPPLMPCGRCYYCIHYPQSANKCLTPVYYGRYLGFDKPPHLGADGRNTSMWISTCCPARKSTNCRMTCRCGSAHCPSP
jgi:D-arabinose 1-dehydrogenase-like Zn-dependent alcohol dehydrogenase